MTVRVASLAAGQGVEICGSLLLFTLCPLCHSCVWLRNCEKESREELEAGHIKTTCRQSLILSLPLSLAGREERTKAPMGMRREERKEYCPLSLHCSCSIPTSWAASSCAVLASRSSCLFLWFASNAGGCRVHWWLSHTPKWGTAAECGKGRGSPTHCWC